MPVAGGKQVVFKCKYNFNDTYAAHSLLKWSYRNMYGNHSCGKYLFVIV